MGLIRRLKRAQGIRFCSEDASIDLVVETFWGERASRTARLRISDGQRTSRYLVRHDRGNMSVYDGISVGIAEKQKEAAYIALYCDYDAARYRIERGL